MKRFIAGVLIFFMVVVSSCAGPQQNKKVGRAVGSTTRGILNSTTWGAIIGAVAGGILGGVIGHDGHASGEGAGVGIIGGGLLGGVIGGFIGAPEDRPKGLSEREIRQLKDVVEQVIENKLGERLDSIQIELEAIKKQVAALPEENRKLLRKELEALRYGLLTPEQIVPTVPDPAGVGETLLSELAQGSVRKLVQLQPVYFDFDQSNLSEDARRVLFVNIQWIKINPDKVIQIHGHCDERGTAEYNLALGERRAKAVKDFLIVNGVEPRRLVTISYGEEIPAVKNHSEKVWEQNRRVEFWEMISPIKGK